MKTALLYLSAIAFVSTLSYFKGVRDEHTSMVLDQQEHILRAYREGQSIATENAEFERKNDDLYDEIAKLSPGIKCDDGLLEIFNGVITGDTSAISEAVSKSDNSEK